MYPSNRFLNNLASLQGLQVLIVDNNVDCCDLMTILLQLYGVEVKQAFSVPQALEIFEQWQPYIVVSDIALPKEFLPCYGLAEATLIVSGTDRSEEPLALTIPCSGNEVLDADASGQTGNTRTVVSNGQIMAELSLQIINPETLVECPSHHIGEIWIAGPSITRGYWQKPDKNQETFVFRDGLQFLRTGDLGFLDSQRRLYITGRLKDLIVIDGKNYYPQDIEETVKLSHPALHESNCVVFSVSGTYSPKLVVVTEVARQFYQQIYIYEDEIQQAVKTAVYNHYQLTVHETVVLPLNNIPKTTSGKIQRQRTKLLYLLQELKSLEKVTQVSEG
ncbi:hypothetical protein NUACC21_08270 [Scytonema sp. NUACC21]